MPFKSVAITILSAGAFALAGCAGFTGTLDKPERFHVAQLEGSFTPSEREILGNREPQLGVALSGGGIRSAFYAAGALEALYEKGLLQRADVLSTVSGGGYTGYWLYTGQIEAERGAGHSLPFGVARFGDAFPESLCHLVMNANFVTVGQMIRHPLRPMAIKLYDRRIGEVFGGADTGLTMAEMGGLAQSGHPYLIVNATVGRGHATDWLDGLYEFSGVGTRGAGRDEVRWTDPTGGTMTYRRAVGISGAAFAPFLKQTIPEPPGGANGTTVTLDDGGASDNLGAIALIRRAVPTIVIIDAEQDAGYGFGAYVNLKNRLPRWGANIVVPGIEAFLASGRHDSPDASYFTGNVTGRRGDGSLFTSRIHYLKMSFGATLRGSLSAAWAADRVGPRGWVDFNKVRKDSYGTPQGCSALHGRDLGLPELFGYAVQHYGTWWNRRPMSHLLGGALSLDFPQYSTGDQSMSVDQSPAFIGLGYLQARAISLDEASGKK